MDPLEAETFAHFIKLGLMSGHIKKEDIMEAIKKGVSAFLREPKEAIFKDYPYSLEPKDNISLKDIGM